MRNRSKSTLRRWIGCLLLTPSLLSVGCALSGPPPGGMPGPPPGGPGGLMSAPLGGGPGGMMPPGLQGAAMQGGMPGLAPGMMPGGMPLGMMPGGMPVSSPTAQPFVDPRARFQGVALPAPIANNQIASVSSTDPTSIAQVGFHQPILGGYVGDRGCKQCGPVQPHGYAMGPQGVWNRHDPQEYLCDGGDKHPAARLNRQDLVDGLQPEDTVVHYVTDDGDIEFQASNRTCLYAPRFASVRRITSALAGGRTIGLAQVDRPVSAGRFAHEIPGLVITDSTELGHADVARRIDAMREQIRGVPVEGVLQLEQTGDVLEALAALSFAELQLLQDEEKALLREHALAAITWELNECLEVVIEDVKPPTLTRDEHLRGLTIYEFPDAGRLQITKLADRSDALPGDIVRFVLRVVNVGDSAVSDVTLIDNLTTRLEYVDGSETSTREANFESQPNDGQSLRLVWKLKEPLKVGEEATIRFECQVR
ncbi:MAG: DUF11 domain-containing protein [Planctomycetota bacterium]|nr:DUF11 domain-containing protein [Planctomycetota bacterium]